MISSFTTTLLHNKNPRQIGKFHTQSTSMPRWKFDMKQCKVRSGHTLSSYWNQNRRTIYRRWRRITIYRRLIWRWQRYLLCGWNNFISDIEKCMKISLTLNVFVIIRSHFLIELCGFCMLSCLWTLFKYKRSPSFPCRINIIYEDLVPIIMEIRKYCLCLILKNFPKWQIIVQNIQLNNGSWAIFINENILKNNKK